MRKLLAIIAVMAAMTGAVQAAESVTYNGTVTPTTLGNTLDTGVQEFDSSLGTLTGVTITLNLDLAPYAEIFSYETPGETFSANEWVAYDYDSTINTITLTHGSDSWIVATPTVGTGTITGSGQSIPVFPPATMKLPGSNSASLNWSDIGTTLSEYEGTGTLTLSLDTAGTGQVSSNMSYPIFTSGGADLTGTASVTYEYVPEPMTICLLGLGGLLIRRRK